MNGTRVLILFVFGFLLGTALIKCARAEEATFYVFNGQSVSNSITDAHSLAWGLEQETPTRIGVWDFGYVNEGHKGQDKRDGIYAMYQFPYKFTPSLTTSFAIGPYFTATTITDPDGVHYQDHYSWAGLAAASAEYSLTKHWRLQGRWAHVIYDQKNKDADLFLIGVGYTPPEW